MAVMTLLPDDDNAVSAHWIPVGETEAWECLDDDNEGTSYVKCNDNGEYMVIEFANPSIADAAIASIDSVRFISSGRSSHRSYVARVTIAYATPSGNSDETCNYPASRSDFTSISGTARAHANGTSGGWSYANLESLEMKVLKTLAVEVQFGYLAMEVTYTPAGRDNATFFGTNF